jgi:hypothetical protein
MVASAAFSLFLLLASAGTTIFGLGLVLFGQGMGLMLIALGIGGLAFTVFFVVRVVVPSIRSLAGA